MIGSDSKSSTLASAWVKAASHLRLDIVAPFSVTLPSGRRLEAAVLVKHFGAPNGMLIVRHYDEVKRELGAIEAAGFGFSVLEDPDPEEAFVVDTYAEILRDWGWTGELDQKPTWLD